MSSLPRVGTWCLLTQDPSAWHDAVHQGVLADWHIPGESGVGVIADAKFFPEQLEVLAERLQNEAPVCCLVVAEDAASDPWTATLHAVLGQPPLYAVRPVAGAERPRLVVPSDAFDARLRVLLEKYLVQQQQLAEMRGSIAALVDERRAFLRNVSHELATPLTPIIGYLSLLLKGDLGALDALQLKAVNAMQSAAKRLRSVVDNLLDVSALETSQLHFFDRIYDFAAVLEGALAPKRSAFSDKGVQCVEQLTEGPLRARGDRDKLARALGHLIENALKFTPEGGTVALESSRYTGADGRDMYLLCIGDSGTGIAAEQVARVTDPMFQGDGSVTRVHGGAGLGLAYARRVAEGLGGELQVESPPGAPVAGQMLSGTRVELSVAANMLDE